MAEVKKARLFLRRGTDTDRKTTILCEGELGYSTDGFRVVVGNGTQLGGLTLGTYAYISGGTLGANFHTNLTEASAGGFAMEGDLAVFPPQDYTNAAGATVSPTSGSLSASWTVMMLSADVGDGTGTPNAGQETSWVPINSGIPTGNLIIGDDDISGDKIHGGTISGPIILSSGNINIGGDDTSENLFLSGVALSATLETADQTAFRGDADKVYPLGITGTAQVTALSSSYDFLNSGKDDSSSNFYYDYLASVAAGNTNANALAAAIATSPINAAPTGSLLFIRNKGTREYGTGNGNTSATVTFVVQFMLVGTDPTSASDWRMVSQVYGQEHLVRGTAGGLALS